MKDTGISSWFIMVSNPLCSLASLVTVYHRLDPMQRLQDRLCSLASLGTIGFCLDYLQRLQDRGFHSLIRKVNLGLLGMDRISNHVRIYYTYMATRNMTNVPGWISFFKNVKL